jgi:hypothetical protein
MNKKGKELEITELELAKIRQAEVDCKTAEANFRKAEAALHKFYATGPRKKKKSGRPSSWKSPPGAFFVQEVEDLAKKRNWTKAKALRIVSKQLRIGPVAELVGIEGGVVSGVFNLESSGVEAPDRRPRHEEHYHEA